MATQTLNPYPLIGKQLTDGLDEISKALTPSSTVDDLANAIFKYIQPLYYQGSKSTQIEIEIRSVVYNIINSYNNQKICGNMFNYQQMILVDMMLGETTTDYTPINALGAWLSDIEDNISETKLPIDEQTPLLLGIEVGKSVYNYWVNTVQNPGKWQQFFQEDPSLNYMNIPFWLAACMEGGLIGASGSERGLIAPTTDIVSVEIVSSLIGALAIGAGKVIFKWVPRIQPAELLGGFSAAVGFGDDAMLVGSNKQHCPYTNNCQGGNCVAGCGKK